MRKLTIALSTIPLLALWACGGPGPMQTTDPAVANAAGVGMTATDLHQMDRRGPYTQRNLVSDVSPTAPPAEHHDVNLVNSWGLDALPTSPWWVADNGAGVSTLYNGDGIAQPAASPLVVTIPGLDGQPSAPTGLVANTTMDFPVAVAAGGTLPARFIFDTEDGTIAAWTLTNPVVKEATIEVPASATNGAVFKGLAIASTPAGSRLFATDFHNGMVRVFDGNFNEVTKPGRFTDKKIPMGFAPFGIRVIHDIVLVTYAKQDAARHDDVAGLGNGFVDAYSEGGRLLARVASRGKLNSPWGVTLAPAGFGPQSFRLLVGNFGDGHIVSFGLHREDGRDRGDQRDDMDDDGVYFQGVDGPIAIDGLWALSFGNGAAAGPTNTLFFTSGPNGEADGLFGRIDFTPGSH